MGASLPCLCSYQKNEIHLIFNHIPSYTNNIHKNNHKSQQNEHKIKRKQGRVWAFLVWLRQLCAHSSWAMKPNTRVLPKVVDDCYGNGVLKGDERSGDEELQEGEHGPRRFHMWRWDLNLLARVSCHCLHAEEDGNWERTSRASKLMEDGTHKASWL